MKPAIELVHHHYMPGYLHGRRQPSLLLALKATPQLLECLAQDVTRRQLQGFIEQFNRYCGAAQQQPTETVLDGWPELVEQLVHAADNVLRYFKFPILDGPELLNVAATEHAATKPTQVLQAIPHCDPSFCLQALKLVIDVISTALHRRDYGLPSDPIESALTSFKNNLKQQVSALFFASCVPGQYSGTSVARCHHAIRPWRAVPLVRAHLFATHQQHLGAHGA